MQPQQLSASRTRRRLDISIGRAVVRYEHVTDVAVTGVPATPQLTDDRARSVSPMVMGFIGGVLLLAAGVITAVQEGRAGQVDRGPVLSVPVPEAIHKSPKKIGLADAESKRPARNGAAPPRLQTSRLLTTLPSDDWLAAPADHDAETAPLVRYWPGRDQAIRNAYAAGTTQQWTDDARDLRGFVVVGLPETPGDKCRKMSVLTKAPSGNTVEHLRLCDKNGAIITDQ